MYPTCNQLARIYGTAKTHKFNNMTETNINDLKFRPIIDQTNTYTNHEAKVISDLKPLRSMMSFYVSMSFFFCTNT